jgi:PleD family two-component response regulator
MGDAQVAEQLDRESLVGTAGGWFNSDVGSLNDCSCLTTLSAGETPAVPVRRWHLNRQGSSHSTELIIMLPLNRIRAPGSVCMPSSQGQEPKPRLLYVGADVQSQIALRKALSETEIGVLGCSDHESAVLFLKSQIPYHLLLVDMEWHGKEGFQLAQLANSLRHRKRMSTILVSAKRLSKYMDALARNAGIETCVKKTDDMGEVTEVIKRVMSDA